MSTMAKKEWVERGAALKALRYYYGCSIEVECDPDCPVTECAEGRIIMTLPAADVVPRAAYEQMKRERDVAMQQLNDAGIPFCGEMGGKRDEFFDRYLGKPVGECMCREKRVIQNGRDDSKEEEQ